MVTVLDQQIRLKINNFLSHHTVPKVSWNNKIFSFKHVIVGEFSQKAGHVLNNLMVVVELLGHLVAYVKEKLPKFSKK